MVDDVYSTDPRPLTRKELSQFLPDQRSIRAFEKLFSLIPTDLVALFVQAEENLNAAATANTHAVSALNSPFVNHLQFYSNPKHPSNVKRAMAWNDADDTVNIFHSDDVVQQIGEEIYARATNSSGVAIANGAAVALDPAGPGFQNHIADGSLPIIYTIGLATQAIDAGDTGRVTFWGQVRGVNTAAFSVGDILYVSPSTLGGLTNVRPTSPDFVIPMGVVVVAHATLGQIYVRPTLFPQFDYGAFTRLANATPAAINTAYTIEFTNTEVSNGVTIGTPTSRLVVAESGLYSINVSFTLVSGSASVKNVWLWFRINGVDVPNSAIIVSLDSGTAIKSPSRGVFFLLDATDYVELMWASDSTNVTLQNNAATAFAPATPACIVTMQQFQL